MPSDPTVISYPALPVDRLQSIKKALAEIFGKLTISEQEALRGHDAKRIHCRVLEQRSNQGLCLFRCMCDFLSSRTLS